MIEDVDALGRSVSKRWWQWWRLRTFRGNGSTSGWKPGQGGCCPYESGRGNCARAAATGYCNCCPGRTTADPAAYDCYAFLSLRLLARHSLHLSGLSVCTVVHAFSQGPVGVR